MKTTSVCLLLAVCATIAAPPAAAQLDPMGPEVPLFSVAGFAGVVTGDSDVTLFGVQADLPIAAHMSFTGEVSGFTANVACRDDPEQLCDSSGFGIGVGPRMWFLDHDDVISPYVVALAGFAAGGDPWEAGIMVAMAAGFEVRFSERIGVFADGNTRWVLDDSTGADFGLLAGIRYRVAR